MTNFQGPLQTSGTGDDVAVSADGQVFTARFADFQVAFDTGDAPMAARWEWISVGLSVTGAGTGSLTVSGFVACDDDARATLFLVVDGAASATVFGPDHDGSIELRATWEVFGRQSTLPVAVGVLIERYPGTEGSAAVAISAIDGGIGDPFAVAPPGLRVVGTGNRSGGRGRTGRSRRRVTG